MKALSILALVVALITGYVLWGVFVYAPLLGNAWTVGLVAFSAVAILVGILSKPLP